MKKGILYGLSHFSWFQYKKMGRTRQTIQKRISNMQTSLLGEIDIIYTTNELLDCYFYEYLMKQILKNYRIKPNKEMFDVYDEDIKMLFDFINELNSKFNTEEKLNWYIENFYPEYLKKRKYVKSETSSSEKPKRKKKRVLYVDTSY
jgi:hypothetical protein